MPEYYQKKSVEKDGLPEKEGTYFIINSDGHIAAANFTEDYFYDNENYPIDDVKFYLLPLSSLPEVKTEVTEKDFEKAITDAGTIGQNWWKGSAKSCHKLALRMVEQAKQELKVPSDMDELKKWLNGIIEHYNTLKRLKGFTDYDSYMYSTIEAVRKKIEGIESKQLNSK